MTPRAKSSSREPMIPDAARAPRPKYNRMYAGLVLRPSAYGLIAFRKLTRDVRATLVGINAADPTQIRLKRHSGTQAETWSRHFWIPLRGNRQWHWSDDA